MRRTLSLVVGTFLAAAMLVVPMAPAAAESAPPDTTDIALPHTSDVDSPTAAATWRGSVSDAVHALPTRADHRSGYDRGKFAHWIDADGDCQDTRAEVLVEESTTATSGGCTIRTGTWTSYYDGVTTTTASALDVDHMVPLAEAWRSGAHAWSAETRKRFANDLGAPRSLVAVTASTNRSKSDRDPAAWLPARNQCRYAKDWVATKVRWGLSADRAEKDALASLGARCGGAITVRIANPGSVPGGGNGGGGASNSVPVYRFWSSTFDNAHFYTISTREAQNLHSKDRNWAYEGKDFRVFPVKNKRCQSGTKAAFRFWSSSFQSHFYTINAAEAKKIRRTDKNWSFEGTGFCAAMSTTDTVPVFRFWSSKFGKHFFTANPEEAKKLRVSDPNWAYEGVAWQSPTSGASSPDLKDPPKPKPKPKPKPDAPRVVPPSPGGWNCPAGYPIKGNHSSSGERIYHKPGGAYYDRTRPEECFASERDARNAGYRPSQR